MNKKEIADLAQTTEQTNNVDVDFGASVIRDNSLVDISINNIGVKVPKMYLDDETAIAGGINPNGTVTFHRCKPHNKGNYGAIKTPAGTLKHNAQFGARLRAFSEGV